MDKLLAIYFSGTGNSKRIIDSACEEFKKRGYQVTLVDASKEEKVDINDYSLVAIAYPIYAFNAPKPITSFISNLDRSTKSINCIILKNSGEHLFWNNASSLKLVSLLKRKNIKVTNEYHYLMPYSFVFRHSDYMAYRMYDVAKKLIPLDIDDFLAGKPHRYPRFILDRQFSFVLRIQRFGGKLNGRFYKVDEDKCIKCNKCIANCPAHNISLCEGKIKFNGNCLMCQRCAMYCPTQAISVGLFKKWEVGSPYSFIEMNEFQEEVKPNFCKKNYKKYFEESMERLNHE